MFIFSEIFTVLKGLDMFSSPDMPVRSYLLLGSLACFGVTLRFSVLKLYCVTYEIVSYVKNLYSRYSAPSSVSLA